MKVETRYIKDAPETTDAEGRSLMKFEAFVNHKRQGVIIGVRSTPEEYQKTREKFTAWMFEGDPFPGKTYPTDDDAIVALCAKTGRKLKIDKDGKLKKR